MHREVEAHQPHFYTRYSSLVTHPLLLDRFAISSSLYVTVILRSVWHDGGGAVSAPTAAELVLALQMGRGDSRSPRPAGRLSLSLFYSSLSLALSLPLLMSISQSVSLSVDWEQAGVPVTIFRPGMITGHSATGFSNPDDYFNRLLRAYVRMGLYFQEEVFFLCFYLTRNSPTFVGHDGHDSRGLRGGRGCHHRRAGVLSRPHVQHLQSCAHVVHEDRPRRRGCGLPRGHGQLRPLEESPPSGRRLDPGV